MKLYTEEQVEKAFKAGMSACMKHQDWALAINYPNKIELSEHMKSVTPIELPSDEEMYEEAKSKGGLFVNWNMYETSAFVMGAQWMRDKIKGGEK